ncbi:MAG: UDP-N-acetylmuramoyl-tripeptide--D-alanyl-D-alanine ligase [candidate division BRC1 bacterium ADurb.BinA292]|nr:MAG: UDP-N-acetylmuramoyl-tripeptide--D-alanyl-D-alanine ligase [candidate division BRC1 bacterium ADurb.BinA292]
MTPAGLPPLEALTVAEAASILGARYDPIHAERTFGAICTDSRAIAPGQYFLALRGETHDGHRFCGAAVERGAAGLIIARDFWPADPLPDHLPILRVEDTLFAYGQLAADRRRRWGGRVLALSGSAGKTTTRRLLAAALARRFPTLEPLHNYNNLIGVPHTLLRLNADHQVAVLELGMNQPGELARLTRIADPDAALLTQIGLTHVGMFPSVDGLIDAKLDLFRNTAAGRPLVVNAGCPRTMMRMAEFSRDYPITYFLGEGPARYEVEPAVRISEVRALSPVHALPDVGYRFNLELPGGELRDLELRLFGRHHLENVAAAAALLLAGGYDPAWIADVLPEFHTEPLRGQVVRAGELTLILDCYNASPPSMLGALQSLAHLPLMGRRVLVLADMLELGAESEVAHEMLLGPLREIGPTPFFGLGTYCAHLAEMLFTEGWPASGFDEQSALVTSLRETVRPGDVVLFKGSHGFALERVAQALVPDVPILPDGH